MRELIEAIKAKKGLQTLDDDFVQQKIDKIFDSNHTIKRKYEESRNFSQFSRSKEFEELLKRIRKELRSIYGVFQEGVNREEVLLKLRLTKDENEKRELVNLLLESHTSTRERVQHYNEIYKKISELKPKTVLDLGCGMNPVAYNYFVKNGCEPKIIASDISQTDMDFLDEFFKTMKIPGETMRLDAVKEYEKLKNIRADTILMFKLLDSLEEAQRHISYKIFDNINAKHVITSFPTKSLGGKKNLSKGRLWFERLLQRKQFEWKTFSVENELFYIIRTA